VIAVAYVAVALPEGGYGSGTRAIAAMVLWGLVIVGLAFGIWPRAGIPRPALIAGSALGGLALLTLLSMLWSSDGGRTFEEVVRVLTYLGLFVCVVLSTRAGSARTWLNGLALGLGLVGLIALASVLLPELFPTSPVHELRPDTAARLSYPLDYWNGVGLVAAGAIVLLGWAGATAASRWARGLAAAALPLLGLTLFLTSSRGSMAALALALVILVVLDRRRVTIALTLVIGGLGSVALILIARSHPAFLSGLVESGPGLAQAHQMLWICLVAAVLSAAARILLERPGERLAGAPWLRRAWIVVAALAALIVIVGAIRANPVEAVTRFCEPPPIEDGSVAIGSHLRDASGSGRCQFWGVALGAFEAHPLLGIGAGGYKGWWGEHATLGTFVQNAHSLPFETLAELGIVGLVLVLAFLITPLAAGFGRRRDEFRDPALAPALALLAAGVLSSAIDWMWELPAAFAPAVIAAGLLTGPALAPAPTSGRSRFGFGLLTILAGWAALLAAAAVLFTDYKIQQSKDAYDANDSAKAILYAREARALQPWAAEPRLQEMFAQELAGNMPAALAALDEALARAPLDWQLWYQKSRLLKTVGDLDDAKIAGHAMILLRPDIRLAPQPAE
jgi:hypothetical protein